MQCLLLDLDAALPQQPCLAHALSAGEAQLVDARDLGPRLRIVGARRALAALEARITAVRDPARGAPLVFYGSGDFHHLAALLVRPVAEPFIILQFDNHPDWTTFPATMNCGAWVNRALENPALERVVTIGPSGEDFIRPQLKWANLAAIRQGRLEVHPWRAGPTRLLGAAIDAPGCHTEGSGPLRHLHWHTLEQLGWENFAESLDARLPPLPIWISLDKDVLRPDEAVTNWDQGGLQLEPILALVARLGERRRILGMDVCGDYSPPRFKDPFRAFLSATDRPRIAPDEALACAVNDNTNGRILAAARSLLA